MAQGFLNNIDFFLLATIPTLYSINRDILKQTVDLIFVDLPIQLPYAFYSHGVLRSDCSDDAHTIGTQSTEGLQVCLDSRTPAGI